MNFSKNFQLVVAFFALVFITAVVGSFILLYLIRKAAKIMLYFILLLIPISLIALGMYLVTIQPVVGAAILIPGFIFLVLFFYFRRRIALAGRAMQLSAQALLDEKETIFATFFSALFAMITFFFLTLTSVYVADIVFKSTNNRNYAIASAFIVFFLGSWSTAFVSYLMEGAIAGIVHDWYRSPQVDVATFGRGLRRALKVQGGIAIYALLMVTLRFIVEYLRSQARRGKSIVTAAAAAIAEIARGIIQFITIYAIPAMVIRQTGFKNGVKDSWSKLKDLFIETIAANFGFGFVTAIFTILMIFFYGGIGYYIGIFVLHPIVTTTIGPIPQNAVGIISAIGFLVIGLIPTILIFHTLGIAFTTILYEFGLDIEFARKGIVLPKRLPEDIEKEFREILAQRGVNI